MRTLSTTRADSGALTTTTPGRPGGGGLDPLLASILQRRIAASAGPRPGSGLVGGRAPEMPSGGRSGGGGQYAPALAAPSMPKTRAPRLVQVRHPSNSWAGSGLDSITYQTIDPEQDVEATDFRRDQTPLRVDYGGRSRGPDDRMDRLNRDQSAALR